MVSRKKGKKKGTDGHISGTAGLKLIQHKHCAVCGKAQLLDDPDCCSDECRKTLDENIAKKKRNLIYMVLLMVALVAFWIFLSYGGF